MKSSACRFGMTFLLVALAIPVSAAESGKAAPVRAAAPPDAATNAPPIIIEHRGENVFQAVELNAVAGETQAEEGGAENRLMFVTGDGADQVSRRWKERLADPEQRVTLRVEQRISIQQQYPDAGRVLGLDDATERKLIDVLTDQQMSHLDRMFGGARPQYDNYREAQATTRRLDELREVLGDAGLDRFENYRMTLSERHQVRLVAARLGPGNELRLDQEERLIALLNEQTRRDMEAVWNPPWRLRGFEGRKMPSREEMQRESQLSTIAGNEESWRRRQVANREIEKQAAEFLTPVQLAALSKHHAQEQERLRQWIESARAEVGMDPKIPEQAVDVSSVPGKLVDGQVQIEIRLTVDRAEPTVVTQTVRNGESFTFEAAEGLIAEATPKLYEDHWLYLRINYYEQGAAGKRPLQGSSTFGLQTRLPNGTPNQGGGGGTVITGRKGYAIEAMISATAL